MSTIGGCVSGVIVSAKEDNETLNSAINHAQTTLGLHHFAAVWGT
jgi:hypothetical protein